MNTATYIEQDAQWVEQGCSECEWATFAESFPEAISEYHAHLREHHPDAWLQA